MSKDKRMDSYVSADNLPIKLLKNKDMVESISEKGIIPPYHVQILPTNACNLTCDFCSFDDRDMKDEIPIKKLEILLSDLEEYGTKAITYSGGGDPLMHKNINELFEMSFDYGFQGGLITNGLLFNKVDYNNLNTMTWCRISNGDFRKMSRGYQKNLEKAVNGAPDVDWSFSHVVSTSPNIKEIERVISFANDNDMSHVRLVTDMYANKEVDMSLLKEKISVDDSRVIYQGKKKPEKGMDCYVAYLKPVINADGNIYRCCGVSYAFDDNNKKFVDKLKMGSIDNLEEAFSYDHKEQGNDCIKCYYGDYNRILEKMLNPIEHERFL